jgi:hypothetical protein
LAAGQQQQQQQQLVLPPHRAHPAEAALPVVAAVLC